MATKSTLGQAPPELLEMVDRLENIRAERRLNKEEFEGVAGIPTGNYSRWTSPNRERVAGIRVATVLTMAQRLGVHAAELLFGWRSANDRTARQSEAPGSETRPSTKP